MIPERFRGQIEALLEPGFNNLEQVDQALAEGAILGWFGRDSAIIGFIEEHDAGAKALRIIWGVGDLSEIRNEMQPPIEAWAKSQGCRTILVQGRKGWERALPGYRLDHIVVRKEI